MINTIMKLIGLLNIVPDRKRLSELVDKIGLNDSGISFKLRDGKIIGDWVLSIYEKTSTNTNVTSGTPTSGTPTVTVYKEVLTGGSIIKTKNG